MRDAWSLLQARRRTGAGLPLVTYVDAATGERTELSAVSTENAAAKVANALRDEFGLEPGDTVGVHLPVHWQRSAWCAGIWTAGCVLAPDAEEADLVVAAPAAASALAGRGGREVAVVSLHPFGLPIAEPLPEGCIDVTLTVRQQPDAYLFEPPSPGDPALALGGTVLTQDAALDRAAGLGRQWGLATGGRLLAGDAVAGLDGWLCALAVPLACGASVVLVSGDVDAREVAEQERVTAHAR